MTIPISTTTAEHYTWGSQCDGWHLVRDANLSVIQERMPPGTSEVRHRHARARQFFYVVAGQLQLEVEGSIYTLIAGVGVEVPPGVTHQVHNRSAEPVEFLVISQPPSHGDREIVNAALVER